MKTIYNTFVKMESQEQCDRMKKVCIENGLNKTLWDSDFAFYNNYKYFLFSESGFFVASHNYSHIGVSESKWLELLKTTK